MPYGNINVDTVTTSTAGGILGAGNASIMKNRIINGAMVIDQRNAGASVTPTVTGSGTYASVDRWAYIISLASKFTMQQNGGSVTPPAGFPNYLGITSTASTSVGTSEYFGIYQIIEGYNFADLNWGTANAKTITISFWIRSSLTGTFGGSLRNGAVNRSYPFTYTISSANTWEQKSVTIAGDTTGTWVGATNGSGVIVFFDLGTGTNFQATPNAWIAGNYPSPTGATSVVGTNGATFYITGVQLEVGSSATGFEYVNYQTSLANCQRYYQLSSRYEENVIGLCTTTTTATAPVMFAQVMRASPTMTLAPAGSTAGCISFLTGGATPAVIGTHSAISITNYGFRISASGYTAASWAIGVATNLYAYTNPTTVYTASAEL
jgi:hypothetical protein